MPRFVMVQGDGRAIFMPPDFADQAEAEAYAAEFDITGNALLQTLWYASPAALAVDLELAKGSKQGELSTEGDRRSLLVDEHFQSVSNGFVLGLVVNALTPLGNSWNAVAVAWDNARQDIDALVDPDDVNAYDVVTDPAWP